MTYHDNSEPAYRDYGQMANDEAAGMGIPAEDVDAALRRIERAYRRVKRHLSHFNIDSARFEDTIAQERERLGLPKEVRV